MPSAHVVNDRLLGSNMGAQNPRSDADTRAQVQRILGHESAGWITLEASWNEDGRHTAARQMVRKCGDKIPMRPPLRLSYPAVPAPTFMPPTATALPVPFDSPCGHASVPSQLQRYAPGVETATTGDPRQSRLVSPVAQFPKPFFPPAAGCSGWPAMASSFNPPVYTVTWARAREEAIQSSLAHIVRINLGCTNFYRTQIQSRKRWEEN
jgi:hypothetical protein